MLQDIASRVNRKEVLDIDNDYHSSSEDSSIASSQGTPSSTAPSSSHSLTLKHRRTSSSLSAPPSRASTSIELQTQADLDKTLFLDQKRVSRFLKHVRRTSRHRVSNRDGKTGAFRSRFGTSLYGAATTIFDSPQFHNSDAFGIYVLFWLGTAFVMLRSIARHYAFNCETSILDWPVVKILLTDIHLVALVDLGMYLSTYMAFFIQYCIKRNWLAWDGPGYAIQSVYTAAFFVFWLVVASQRVMDFSWIARVFLVLHSLVLVMKMHSYAMYNGYLWNLYAEYNFSVGYLSKLKLGDVNLPPGYDLNKVEQMLTAHIQFCEFELEHQSRSTVVSAAKIEHLLAVPFPENITLLNFFEYSMFPTVVYTIAYPRTTKIRWSFVAEKVIGIFGIIFLMILVAQGWIYPLALECLELRKLPARQRIMPFLFKLLDIIPAFMMEYLFTFFVIWDAILNAIAELSRYGDREFYGPWWSCTDWLEFSRLWNVPVHKFLLRHVYHSLISTFDMSKTTAGLVTFVLSSIVHEIVMYVIYGRIRGYLLVLQMTQLPLIALSRTKLFRRYKVLGNIVCWVGFISGPGMVCVTYLVF